LVTAGANAGDTGKACPSLPAVRNGISLIRTKAAITAAKAFRNGAEQRLSQEVHLGGYAASRIGSSVVMTTRIREFLKQRTDDGPCLVVDLDVVRDNYQSFAKALPDTKVYYAVKANPAPQILKLLTGFGCCFDVASLAETHDVLAAGATADRISYGNTIKKETEIAAAFALGVTLFAVDCEAEVEKVARAAPGSRVICRIVCDGSGAEWPLSRKFGCEPVYAADILEHAHKLGLVPHGVSFHVGSQQHNVEAWDRALASTAAVFRACAERGISLAMVNLGGGFPARYVRKTPKLESYGKAIFRALRKHFGNNLPNTIVEPGRGLVGNAGMIEAEVVLIAKRSPEDEVRWVYLDIGKFHGLAETIGESIRYPIRTTKDRDETVPCIIAGPTCDSVDVLYEKTPYPLPVSLAIGDKVLIEAAGAYTATYSSVGFNGYPPLRQYVI
jgi:ornithine decarboxylase